MKKTEFEDTAFLKSGWKKVLMIMKLTFFLIFLGLTGVSASVYSQSKKLTLDVENGSIREVFDLIESQSEFVFIYKKNVIDPARKVNLKVEELTIDKVLDKLFRNSDTKYEILNRQIILTPDRFVKTKPVDLMRLEIQQPQQKEITGKVTDTDGLPLPGVSVIVKGTTIGTVTNGDGEFSLNIPLDAETLQFSFVGMRTQEVPVEGRTTFTVVMEEETIGIDEVVAVGYGTMRKINLTGSISSVDSEDLNTVVTPSLPMAMMGRASGLFVKNTTGEPGNENATSFNIRGFGTPLIIIDGMPASNEDFNHLDPNSIEEFNVLKDGAAGAIYGARAGNGVILVTTKRGKQGMEFMVSSDYAAQFWPYYSGHHIVDASEYAKMENVGKVNAGRNPVWSDEEIQKLKDGTDPMYPNNNWSELVLRKFAPSITQSINIRGGTENIKYSVSGRYLYQEAQIKANEIKLNRFTLRSNVDAVLTPKLDLGVDMNLNFQDYFSPLMGGEEFGTPLRRVRRFPYYKAFLPDPDKLPAGDIPSVMMYADNYGYFTEKKVGGDAKISLSYDLPFNLRAKALIQISRNDSFHKERELKNELYWYDYDTDEYTLAGYTNPSSTLSQRMDFGNSFNQQYFLDWDMESESANHKLSALAVYEILWSDNEWFSGYRRDYIFDIDYLFAGPDLDKDNDGSGSRNGRKSIISRVNYNYKEKYMVELNGRYDASPRFPKETRWGFFPSVSVGWRLSEEGFMRNYSIISNLKLRASHGKLGNDATGNWQYLTTFSQSSQYIVDGSSNELLNTLRADALANPKITWEKISITDVGLDFALWKGKLEGSADYFYRLRSDVLGSRIRSIPDIVGARLPNVNYAKKDNRGWDFSLKWHDKLGEFDYNIGGNISFNREKTLVIDQNPFPNRDIMRRQNVEGQWTDRFWGYMTDGLFKSQEEIEQWADIDGKNNASVFPGDIKFVDYNDDGRITVEDQVIIGRGIFPRYTYGINLNLFWKSFNLSMLWQGAGAFDTNINVSRDLLQPFLGGGSTPLRTMYDDSYIPENPWMPTNIDNPIWPRFGDLAYNRDHRNYKWLSDYWLFKGDFLRLKTLQIGYTLSSKTIQDVGFKSCKLYISGYNLLTFSNKIFKNLMDPEGDNRPEITNSLGLSYPVSATVNAGFVLQF